MGAALTINAAMALTSPALNDLPLGLGMMGGGLSLAALLALTVGWKVGLRDDADEIFDSFCIALGVAGLIGLVLAGVAWMAGALSWQVALGLACGLSWAMEEDAALIARCELTDILNESKRTKAP